MKSNAGQDRTHRGLEIEGERTGRRSRQRRAAAYWRLLLLGVASPFAAAVAFSSLGCDPLMREVFTSAPGGSSPDDAIGLGEVCVPTDESFGYFSGFTIGEINLSLRDPQCATGTCLVEHFQGRVTCPDGNLSGGECFTPLGERVTEPVQPQLAARPPEDSVYCTCRCDGPAEYAPFCDCPSDMVCELSIESGGLTSPGPDRGEGSYCVHR